MGLLSKIPSDFQKYLGSPLDLCVAPIWNVRSQAHVGCLLYGFKDTTGRWRRASEATEICDALKLIERLVLRDGDSPGVGMILLPVNYEAIRRPTRFYALLRQIKELKPAIAKRLIVELVAVPTGHPSHLLLEKIRSLSAVVKQVTMRVEGAKDAGRKLRALGIRTITIDFNAVGLLGHAAREREMNRFVSSAHDFGLSTIVVGVSTLHALTSAIAAGANFVCGAATSMPGLQFNRGLRVSASHLYKTINVRLSGAHNQTRLNNPPPNQLLPLI